MNEAPVALIVAQAQNRVIGLNNAMPWHLPEDLRYFKQVTLGKPVIMGRKTFESIGRPLPGRHNIVITRQSDWQSEGVSVAGSLADAIALARQEQPEEVMVIGGGQIYAEALPLAKRVYLTRIGREFEGDAWFPELGSEWCEVSRKDGISEASGLPYAFCVLESGLINN
ncbi:dihydrofolate reductase [Pseudomaricurvus sp. HS19]|uniref:dihydrofolate reductase n=1 Tax=Pseudomaricurvus sp. HS19 TaxID=2692626 RepID=UPI00136A8D01|nr:dihydrofolate reductase [Pseudomaricurvus sp. HS19]MYM63481.1 dihydrofolate reductase [Pseudomaricurvus sp. HS19]